MQIPNLFVVRSSLFRPQMALSGAFKYLPFALFRPCPSDFIGRMHRMSTYSDIFWWKVEVAPQPDEWRDSGIFVETAECCCCFQGKYIWPAERTKEPGKIELHIRTVDYLMTRVCDTQVAPGDTLTHLRVPVCFSPGDVWVSRHLSVDLVLLWPCCHGNRTESTHPCSARPCLVNV